MLLFFVYLALFAFFAFLLIKSTDVLMEALRELVITTNIEAYGISTFLMAFSTSLPELLVGISAGVQGEPTLALGNILGSNIANLSLVLGGAALISGTLKATDNFLKKEVFYVFLAGSFPLILLLDSNLSRLDGVILLFAYVLYNFTVLDRKREKLAEHEMHEAPLWRRMLIKLSHPKVGNSLGMLFLGAAMLIISADLMVRLGTAMAHIVGVPVLMIGLFVVAVGTSLPELAFEIAAVRKKEVAMAFGNILGSVVTNSTAVLGLTVLFTPIQLQAGLGAYLIATLAFVAVFFLFWLFVWTKHKLERWEGAVMFAVYLLFAWFEFLRLSTGH